jgi:hypothetical protein
VAKRLRPRIVPSGTPTPTSIAASRPSGERSVNMEAARALAGGRVSLDSSQSYMGQIRVILPPPDAESVWRFADLDDDALRRFSPSQLLQMLADLSPDISRAVWDFLRMCNPGWEVVALVPGTEKASKPGQVALDAFLGTLHDLYGSVDVIIGRLFMSAFLRGALMAELVLDEAGRIPVDLATPDPASARFERIADPVRGTVWRLGQYQFGGFVELDRPTIRYVPVDPFPGSPYGRAPASPGVFTALFLLGLLHDLRRVMSQQGYPRIDVAVDLVKLRETMPAELASDPAQFQEWAGALMTEVRTAYRNLRPDDAYIHSDVVTINRPVGAADSSSLGAIDGIVSALERMSARALKTMPLMMGLSESNSETQANRQWEVFSASVKSIQHLAETLLERLLGLALQSQGVQATVRFRFAELRAAEMLRDAQTEQLQISNAFQKYAYGWTSIDEAAQVIVGHKADQQTPRYLPTGAGSSGQGDAQLAQAAATAQADPGSNRGTATTEGQR